MADSGCILAYITFPSEDAALKSGSMLIERGLAAGVNILPQIHSIYRWRGEIKKRAEWLLLAQLPERNFEALKNVIAETHPYEVPCIIALKISAGHAPFIDWLNHEGYGGV